MPLIYHGLIIDQKKNELHKDSFLKLKTALLNILISLSRKDLFYEN